MLEKEIRLTNIELFCYQNNKGNIFRNAHPINQMMHFSFSKSTGSYLLKNKANCASPKGNVQEHCGTICPSGEGRGGVEGGVQGAK